MRRLIATVVVALAGLSFIASPAGAHNQTSLTESVCEEAIEQGGGTYIVYHSHATYMDVNHVRFWCEAVSTALSPTCTYRAILWAGGQVTIHDVHCSIGGP